jgi:hypothetical protein
MTTVVLPLRAAQRARTGLVLPSRLSTLIQRWLSLSRRKVEAVGRQEGTKRSASSSSLHTVGFGEVYGISGHRVLVARLYLLQEVRRGSSERH